MNPWLTPMLSLPNEPARRPNARLDDTAARGRRPRRHLDPQTGIVWLAEVGVVA